MSYDVVVLAPPIVGGLANLAVQILSHRWKLLGFVKSIVAGFVIGLAVLFLIQGLRILGTGANLDEAAFLVGNCGLYVCGSYLFFQLANIGEASIRFRILREFKIAGGRMKYEELTERYNDRGIMRTRIKRLTQNGQIREVGDRYEADHPAALVAAGWLLTVLKRTLLGKASEFD